MALPSTTRPMPAWHLAAITVASLVVAQFPTFLTAGVAVQMQRDLGFGKTELGIAIAASLAASFLGSVGVSRFVQRAGWTVGMRATAVFSALSLAGVAALAGSWWSLAILLAIGGAAKAIGHPSANLALATEGSIRRQGLMFGIKQAGVPAAAMLAGLSVPAVALTLGWQSAFWLAAALAFGFGLAVPRRPSAVPGLPRPLSTPKPNLQSGTLVLLAAGAGMGVAVSNSLAGFLTTYGVSVGFSEAQAGLLLALGSSTGLAMRIFLGWLADRVKLGLGFVAGLLVIGAGGVLLLNTGTPTLVVIGSVVAFGTGWGWAGLFNLALVRSNPRAPAVATGFTQAGVYAGAGLGPLLFGFVSEQTSFSVAWSVLAATAVLAAATMLAGHRATRRAPALEID